MMYTLSNLLENDDVNEILNNLDVYYGVTDMNKISYITQITIFEFAQFNFIKFYIENINDSTIDRIIGSGLNLYDYKKWIDMLKYTQRLKSNHITKFIFNGKIDVDYIISLMSYDMLWDDCYLIKLLGFAFINSSLKLVSIIIETWPHILEQIRHGEMLYEMSHITDSKLLAYILDFHILDEMQLGQLLMFYCDNINNMKLLIDAGAYVMDVHLITAIRINNIAAIKLILSYGITFPIDVYEHISHNISVETMQFLTHYDIYPSRDNFIDWCNAFFYLIQIKSLDVIAEFDKYIEFDKELVEHMLKNVHDNIFDKQITDASLISKTSDIKPTTLKQMIIDIYGHLLDQ